MSFQVQPDGSLRGYGPDADYPGRTAAEEHWRTINRERAEARRAGAPITDWKSPLTLEEQADKQVARLEREIAEWRAIKWKAEL